MGDRNESPPSNDQFLPRVVYPSLLGRSLWTPALAVGGVVGARGTKKGGPGTEEAALSFLHRESRSWNRVPGHESDSGVPGFCGRGLPAAAEVLVCHPPVGP